MRLSAFPLRVLGLSMAIVTLSAVIRAQEGGQDKKDDARFTPEQEADRLFDKRGSNQTRSLEGEVAHVDPTLDGWRTEVLQEQAKVTLYDLLGHAFEQGIYERRELSTLLSAEFEELSRLRPADMEPSFKAGGIVAYRPAEITEAKLAAEEFATQFKLLCEPFESFESKHVAVKIVECVDLGEERFEAVAWIQVDAVTSERAVQQNFVWSMRFDEGEEDRAYLRSIELREFSEVHTKGALFSEVTEFVVGDLPYYEKEIRFGVDDYYYHIDRLTGNAFLGSQGISVGDLNGDGLDDLYVPQQGGLPNRTLLRNEDGTVRDFTLESGVGLLDNTRSALILDLDGDGDQDLALAMGPRILIGLNDGEAHFGDFIVLGNEVPSDIFSISAADADGDGDLDFYACRYIDNGIMGGNPTPYHDANNGSPNIFWRNDGDGEFTDATEEAGFGVNNAKFSLASIWEDFDGDGDMDLYVANDFGRNTLYRNDGETFTEVGEEVGAGETAASMGLACSDIDLDGDMDILVSNMFSAAGRRVVPQSDKFMGGEHVEMHQQFQRHARGNTLLINRGDGTFEDTTEAAGIELGRWAWGGRFIDFNEDGLDDMYVPNGFVTNQKTDDL
ncbi:MAG: hypothetical protein ACI8X5_001848 [Planctomycetota bacterium]|jgi:hypothetical protein